MRQPITTTTRADAVSWWVVGGLALGCLLLGLWLKFSVLLSNAAWPPLAVAVLGAAVAVGHLRGDARLVAGATAFLQMTLFTVLGVMLSYLLAARGAPTWDGWLTAADERLGLNWPAILVAVDRLPRWILLLAGTAYHSLVLQMVGCIVLLAGTGHLERLRTTIAAATLAGGVTILLSGLFPAVGNLFDPAQYEALRPSVAWQDQHLVLGLRDGSIRALDMSHMTGIVSFPSYHAALPVILWWGLYPIAPLRVPAAIWAGLTVLATPVFGGHYVADVLAGLVLAGTALTIVGRLAATARDRNGMHLPGRHATVARRLTGYIGGKHGVEVIR